MRNGKTFTNFVIQIMQIEMKKTVLFLIILYIATLTTWAQGVYPSVDPQAAYITANGEEIDDASSEQDAPLKATFTANPSDVGDYLARYEWKIYRAGEKDNPIVHRFEEDIEYTFTQSGTFYVQLYATFTLGNDIITYPEEGEENPMQVVISKSTLDFPNAFSPNGDPFNNVLKAKEGYQSIIDFHATIINRCGQKIYSWDNVDGEWDGKWNGHTVKDGVYFLIVKALGADGKKYNIRKAINVISGITNKNGGNGDE